MIAGGNDQMTEILWESDLRLALIQRLGRSPPSPSTIPDESTEIWRRQTPHMNSLTTVGARVIDSGLVVLCRRITPSPQFIASVERQSNEH